MPKTENKIKSFKMQNHQQSNEMIFIKNNPIHGKSVLTRFLSNISYIKMSDPNKVTFN